MSVLSALATASAPKASESQAKHPRTDDSEEFDQMGVQNKALFSMFEKLMDNKFDKHLEHMDKKLEVVAAATDAGFKDLKKELETEKKARLELQKDIENVKKSPSRPGSSSFLPPPRRGGQSFIADKVWIKGYIQDWKKKDDTSLTKPKIMEWVKSMHGEMKENIKEHIDLDATEMYANKVLFTKFAIRLKNVTEREVAWSVKNEIERVWSLSNCLINGVTPRAVVEPSPEMKPYIDAGGKCMGALQEKGIHKSSVRPEWGPPVKIFDIREVNRPVCIAEFDGVVGWTIHDDALQALVPGLSVEDFKTTLNA